YEMVLRGLRGHVDLRDADFCQQFGNGPPKKRGWRRSHEIVLAHLLRLYRAAASQRVVRGDHQNQPLISYDLAAQTADFLVAEKAADVGRAVAHLADDILLLSDADHQVRIRTTDRVVGYCLAQHEVCQGSLAG